MKVNLATTITIIITICTISVISSIISMVLPICIVKFISLGFSFASLFAGIFVIMKFISSDLLNKKERD